MSGQDSIIKRLSRKELLHHRGTLRKNTLLPPLEQLVRYYEKGELDMNPPYQRGLVWTEEQKVRLIDSLLYGLEMPAIYLRRGDDMKSGPLWEVVDGKQRIMTIVEFWRGDLAFEGERFPDLPVPSQRRLGNLPCTMVEVQGLTDEEVVELYNRLNFCGVPHTEEDRGRMFQAAIAARADTRGEKHTHKAEGHCAACSVTFGCSGEGHGCHKAR